MNNTGFANNGYSKSAIYWQFILIVLLISVSLYNLFSPPITPVITRQTQTAMLTENFAKEGFSLKGLYLNLRGNGRVVVANEFPIYNFITGLFFLFFKNTVFWGKLISLTAACISLLCLFRLIRKLFGEKIAIYSTFFFILSPIGILMNASVQPDSLGLMFLLIALVILLDWKEKQRTSTLLLFSITLLLSGLSKFPLIVPYLPVIAAAFLYHKGKLRLPRLKEIIIILAFFVLPFIAWYLYRGHLTDPAYSRGEFAYFFIGDLRRFLSPDYYIKPFFSIAALVWCGMGLLFFISGLKKLSLLEALLLIGIPFYFVIVPTVRDQYYYMYPTIPIFALLMGRGFHNLTEYCKRRNSLPLIYMCTFIFFLGFIIAVTYVMRQDKISWEAAKAIKRFSLPTDLVATITIHDRGQGIGLFNPSILYLSNRKGWSIPVTSTKLKDTANQLEMIHKNGASLLVITWYTPDLELWTSKFLPLNLHRNPGVDGKAFFEGLQKKYLVIYKSNNYALLDLNNNRKR